MLPDLNPYLATGIDLLREPDRLLDEAEASVFKIVHKANANAL